jgi:mercuric ion transport protein
MVRQAWDFGKEARKKKADMNVSRSGTAGMMPTTADVRAPERGEVGRQRLVAVGGILGALAASSCCIIPLLLFSLGIGGAWIGNLTALAPYKPLFVAGTAGVLGYGYYLVYWKPRRACAEDAACARPVPNRLVQVALWIATVLVVAAFAFDYIAPLLLGA